MFNLKLDLIRHASVSGLFKNFSGSFYTKGSEKSKDGLINDDIVPLPPSRRTWDQWSYLGFWNTDNFNTSAWATGSSLLSLGLTVGETMGIVIIGRVFTTLICLLNQHIGSKWHIGYTVYQRQIFGIYGSIVSIVMRILLSIVWYGSSAWLGGRLVTCILSSWSYKYLTMDNTLSSNVNMTTRELIGFLVFQLMSMPLLCVKPEKVSRALFITNIYCFFVMLALAIWARCTAGSAGPLVHIKSSVPSSGAGWVWLYGITSIYGGVASGLANSPDYSRFARHKNDPVLGTIFAYVVLGTLIPLMGIMSTSSLRAKYGTNYWNPVDILDMWMTDYNYSAVNRAAVFFVALGFLGGQTTLNLVGNGFAGGIDIAGLLPKFFDVKRGSLLVALLSWAVQPWNFYNSDSTFVTVMGSFSTFMSPLIGVMLCDFYIIRKRNIKLGDLYTISPAGAYYYFHGFNIRALFVWLVTSAIGLPGLINNANSNIKIGTGLSNYYTGNAFFGLVIAGVWYYLTHLAWPIKEAGEKDDKDEFGTFTPEEALKLGVATYIPNSEDNINVSDQSVYV